MKKKRLCPCCKSLLGTCVCTRVFCQYTNKCALHCLCDACLSPDRNVYWRLPAARKPRPHSGGPR